MQSITMPSILVTPEAERVAALRVTELDYASLPEELPFLQWIETFNHYVQERIEDGITTYILDAERAPAGDFASAAVASCAVHNAIPSEMRSSEPIAPQKYNLAAVTPATPCHDQAHWNSYWWGGSIYMNHCLIQDINGYIGNAGKIGGLLGTILVAAGTGPPGWVIGLVSTFLAVNAAWLQQADTHCGGTGAFLQIPWISPGTPFVRQNC